jgi:AcrR family transcriptional regulator
MTGPKVIKVKGKKIFNQAVKRLTILQAAKELFVEKKYSAITMDAIAKHAGITKRTLYVYFPSKLALFISVFDEHLQKLHQKLVRKAKQGLRGGELITAVFDTLYQYSKKNERFMCLYWTLDSEEFDGLIPDELTQRIKVWTKAMFDEVIHTIEQDQKEGLIADYNPELLIHLMSALNKGIIIHTNKENRFSIADVDSDDLYRILTNLIRDALTTPSVRESRDALTRKISPVE